MITMGHTSELLEMIRSMRVTPLTISYEYEPCDALKARELALSENGHYQKQPGEDFDSIKQGIFSEKGHVSLVIGTPVDTELDNIPDELNNNDKLFEVCKLIDRQIYRDYKLYANNYIAHDLMSGSDEYRDYYTEEEKEKFLAYLQRKAIVRDVAFDKMMHYLLHIYATPVDTHFGKNINPIANS